MQEELQKSWISKRVSVEILILTPRVQNARSFSL
jgi:hypothetical protein